MNFFNQKIVKTRNTLKVILIFSLIISCSNNDNDKNKGFNFESIEFYKNKIQEIKKKYSTKQLESNDCEWLFAFKKFRNRQELDFNQERLPLICIGALKYLPNLIKLELEGASINENHLKGISELKKLKFLELVRVYNLGDYGLRFLKTLKKLKSLKITDSQITNFGLSHIEKINSLKKLDLVYNRQIDDDGLKHLAKMTQLKDLGICYSHLITDQGIKNLKDLKKLESLNLAGTSISDESMLLLKNYSNLKHLNLRGTKIGDNGLKYLTKISRLDSLDISFNIKISNEGMKFTKYQNKIKKLNIYLTKLNNLSFLMNLPNLKYLKLAGEQVLVNRDFYYLRYNPHLKTFINKNTMWTNNYNNSYLRFLKNNIKLEKLVMKSLVNPNSLKFPKLKILEEILIDFNKLTPEIVKNLKNIEKIRGFCTESRLEGFKYIKELKSLKQIKITEFNCKGKLKYFLKLPALEELDLRDSYISLDYNELKEFAKKAPKKLKIRANYWPRPF